MERVVGDASVIVKWFIEEEHSDMALKLRDMHVNGEVHLVAPELLPFEVLNAIRYSDLFTLEEIKAIADSLLSYGIELYPLEKELAEKAVEIAVKRDITVYDASYIALARKLNTVFYTADEKLLERLEEKEPLRHISSIKMD